MKFTPRGAEVAVSVQLARLNAEASQDELVGGIFPLALDLLNCS